MDVSRIDTYSAYIAPCAAIRYHSGASLTRQLHCAKRRRAAYIGILCPPCSINLSLCWYESYKSIYVKSMTCISTTQRG